MTDCGEQHCLAISGAESSVDREYRMPATFSYQIKQASDLMACRFVLLLIIGRHLNDDVTQSKITQYHIH